MKNLTLLLLSLLSFSSLMSQTRELLSTNRVYYVRTDGNNSNDGLSDDAGHAWRDPQYAVDFVSEFLDTGRSTLTILLGTGTYGGVVLRQVPGDLCPILAGDAGNWNAVILSATNDYAVLIGNDRLANRMPAPATWTIRNLKVTASGSGGRGVVATGSGTRLNVDSVNFGSCSAEHMVAEFGAVLSVTGPYTVSGGATRHLQSFTGGQISFFFSSLTLTGSPNFSSAFARVAHGGVIVTNSAGSFSGSATGKRYEALLNGVIDTQGAGSTYFPGSSSGSVGSGGQYN